MTTQLNTNELESAVKAMYTRVALEPSAEFHFETGRALAQRLGYAPERLDHVPAPAVDSFAGVGHHFDLAALREGERVLDLGSGSGMDAFIAATYVGPEGRVTGVDMTDDQLKKATRLRDDHASEFGSVEFVKGYIEELPFEDGIFDCIVSNGVVNLVADKVGVFREAARVLGPGGRLAISDIVTGVHLPQSVACDVTLWASCIGGAMHREDYQSAIAEAGLDVTVVQPNPEYHFLAGRAARSAAKFRVDSISLLAVKR